MRQKNEPTVMFKSTVTPEATFTVTAATDIVTANAHGLSEGDELQLTTATTLPAGLALTTSYYVISVTTNTFQLSATRGGAAVDITDTGTGTHTYHLKSKIVYVGDWQHTVLSLNFNTTPTMTVKFQHSPAATVPDFSAAASGTNVWDYADTVNSQNGTSVDGDTGIACTGSDATEIVELNTNGSEWICVAITAYTAGKVGIIARSYND